MNCADFRKLIALEVEGDLTRQEAARVAAHLETCRACREFRKKLQASQAMLKAIAQVAPEGATLDAVRREILNRLPAERAPRAFPIWQLAVGVGVTAILILAMVIHRHPAPAPLAVSESKSGSASTLESARTSPPPAPLQKPVRSKGAAKFHAVSRRGGASRERAEPLTVKLITDNPNIVIYWQVD